MIATRIRETLQGEAEGGCREGVLLGPSTPLLPEVFVDTPVTWLSGIRIESPAKVLRVVSEGGGTRNFSPYVRKLNLRVSRGSGDISCSTPRKVSTNAPCASQETPAAVNNRRMTGADQ